MLDLNIPSSVSNEQITDAEIIQLADELLITSSESCDVVDTIETVINVKEYINANGVTDELVTLIGKDNCDHLEQIDISNEGLGNAMAKFFKWIGDMFKRLFGLNKAKQSKIDKCIEQVNNTKSKYVTIDKLVNLPEFDKFIRQLTEVINMLKGAAARGTVDDKDVEMFSEQELQGELDNLFKAMITDESQEMSKTGAAGYLKTLKDKMVKLAVLQKDLEKWNDDFRAKHEAKGDVKSFVKPAKIAQAFIVVCGKVLTAVNIAVTTNEESEDSSVNTDGDNNDNDDKNEE